MTGVVCKQQHADLNRSIAKFVVCDCIQSNCMEAIVNTYLAAQSTQGEGKGHDGIEWTQCAV